jgi:hypothetical protein
MKNGNKTFCLITGAVVIALMYIHQWVLVYKIDWDDQFVPILYLIYLFVYYLHLFARVSGMHPPSGPNPAALVVRILIFVVIVCLFVCDIVGHHGDSSLYSSVIQIVVSFIIELLLPEYILRMIFAEERER